MDIDIFSVTDIDALDDIEKKLDSADKSLNDEISKLLSRKRELDQSLLDLESKIPNLTLLISDSKNLSTMISFASELAEGVSSKVRQLDLAKSRVYSCSQRVEDILDLKACTDGVQTALKDEDYEKAAGHIHRFLSMDENVLRMTSDASEGSTLEASFKLLRDSEGKLKEIVHNQFDSAVRTNDRGSIERFFKIFPLIGLQKEGLEKFGKFLCTTISEKCKNHIKLSEMSDPARHTVKYADLITVLFESVAEVLEVYQIQVETFYGPGHLFTLICVLQEECDRQAQLILDKFKTSRRFEHLVKLIQPTSRGHARSSSLVGNDKVEPKDLDPVISEIVLLNTRTELYLRFLKRRVTNDINLTAISEQEKEKSVKNAFNVLDHCKLCRQMQDLIGSYIIMEVYFMKEMVVKAISLDSFEDCKQNSTMVDDVFFIVKKCIRRALSSSSVDGICAMLNHATSVLEEQYLNMLATRIKSGFPSGWMQDAYSYVQGASGVSSVVAASSGGGAGGSSGQQARRQFLITLNNVEVSRGCIKSLKEVLQQEINVLFPHEASNEKSKLQTCLSELTTASNRFKEIIDSGFSFLEDAVLKPQVKNFLQPFGSMKHILSEEDLLLFEANDPWVESYIMNCRNLLDSFKDILTQANYDQFIQLLASETVSRLEHLLQKKSFNRLGGFQMDREIRSLVSFMTSTTTWSIRDKFSRITQICILLNLEKAAEVMDYWNTMTWRLTPNEVRQFLTLRTEFRTDEIRRLKL